MNYHNTGDRRVQDTSDFLNSLFGNHEGELPFVLNDALVITDDPAFIAQHYGDLRVCPSSADGVFFLFGVQTESHSESWRECAVIPTATLHKDETSIFCWTFEAPVDADDERVIGLAEAFGMQDLEEPIPLPGTDGWELVHADQDMFYAVGHLADAYLAKTQPEAVAESDALAANYHGAVFATTFDEAKYDGRTLWFAVGENEFDRDWKPGEKTVVEVIRSLTKHVVGKKQGRAVVYGEMDRGPRRKIGIKACTAIPLDYDTGIPSRDLDAALAKSGYVCVRYTSHSHWKTSSDFSLSDVRKFVGVDTEITTEQMRRYVREEKHWEEWIVATVTYVGEDHTADGYVCRVTHEPMPKHRVIIFLSEPFVMREQSDDHTKALEKWKGIVEAVAATVGFAFDPACLNPIQPYFLPRHEKGRPHEVVVFGGELLDWRSLNVSADNAYDRIAAEVRKTGKKSKTPRGNALGSWAHKVADGFMIEEFLEDSSPDRIRGPASVGLCIKCPNDAAHGDAGNPNSTSCFAKNADGNNIFVISCRHAGCRNLTMLDMLGLIIEHDGIDRSLLDDPKYDAVDRGETLPSVRLDGIDEAISELTVPLGDKDVLPILTAIVSTKRATSTQESIWLNAIVTASKKSLTLSALKTDLKQIKARAKAATISEHKGHDSLMKVMSEELGHDFVLPNADYGKFHVANDYDGHVWLFLDSGEEGKSSPAYFTPFDIVGDVRNKGDGTRAIRVRVRDRDNQWTEVDVSVSSLARSSGSEAIETLQNAGLLCRRKGRDFLVEYLSSVKRREINVVSQPGWYDDFFMCPTGETIPADIDVELVKKARIKGQPRNGTLEAWQKEAKWLFGNTYARHWQWAVVSGSAGCIAGLLNDEPLFYYLTGPSKMGKSDLQEGQASVWAIGKLSKGGLFSTAKGTENSMEAPLATGSGTYTGFDEGRHIVPAHLENLFFTVQSGAGKKRGKREGGNRETITWRGGTITISDEWTLMQRLATANIVPVAGAKVRVACIDYRKEDRLSKNDYTHIVALKDNYGQSGPALVQSLFDKGHVADQSVIQQNLARLIAKLTVSCKTDLELHEKAARFAAYIGVTADLMKQAGLIPEAFDSDKLAEWVWKQILASDMAPQNAADSSLAILKSELVARKGMDVVDYIHREDYKSRPAVAYFGAEVGSQKVFVVLADKLTELGGGAASRGMMMDLLERDGALVRTINAKSERTWGSFPGLAKTQYVVLKADWIEEGGDTDPVLNGVRSFGGSE